MTGYIARDKLTNTLRSHRDTPEIKVLTGVRRCGKSTLLEHYAQSLLDDGVPASNIFTRRFDSFDTPIGYSATDLHADLMQATQEAQPGPFYVFLDEIQDVPGLEEVVRRLHSRDDTDVYITGSNARLLSGELATHLTGRYITIPVYPLSFDEYQRHHRAQGTTDSTDQLFSKYMMFGGMPGLFVTGQPDQDRATEILTSIYESIVLKDVAGRYGIRDIATLEKLSRYLFSTSGNLFSVNNVANTLASAGANASYATVDNQISALERSFIVYSAQQERMRGKELLRPRRKFYPVDNGFRNLATGFNGSDRGAQLEGIVFMELQRRGYDVAIGSVIEDHLRSDSCHSFTTLGKAPALYRSGRELYLRFALFLSSASFFRSAAQRASIEAMTKARSLTGRLKNLDGSQPNFCRQKCA